MLQIRYQYLSKNGIQWTNWFNTTSSKKPLQYKSGKLTLRNEYRTIQ